MKSYDDQVADRWWDQMKKDVSAKLAQWHGQSNSKFATNLYNFLNGKYDWRVWHVVAYNEVSGSDKHWVRWCNGYSKFRHHGRNLVVASVNHRKSPINKNDALVTLRKIHTIICVDDWLGTTCIGSKTAEYIYEVDFPKEWRTGCSTFASGGVIKKDAAIAQKAPPNRLAVVNKGLFQMYAFG